jgi:hypothetical protein
MSLATNRRAKRDHDKLVFDVTGPVRLSFVFGPPLALVAAVVAIIQHEPWWLVLILVAFAALGLIAWQPVIVLDQNGITSHLWWRTKSIPWKQLKSVRYYTASLSTQVTGSNGVKIVHTGFHVDSLHFREEITKRSPIHEIEQVDKVFSK